MAQVYELRITWLAQKELASLDKQNYLKVKTAIYALAQNPRPAGCKKLKNRAAWRIRCGNHLVIYEVHDDKVVVIIKPANKNRAFKMHTPLNPLLIEGKAEEIEIRYGTGTGNGVQAGKQP